MNRNILILFMSWLGVTGYGQATSPNETPITIARQGSFAYAGQCCRNRSWAVSNRND